MFFTLYKDLIRLEYRSYFPKTSMVQELEDMQGQSPTAYLNLVQLYVCQSYHLCFHFSCQLENYITIFHVQFNYTTNDALMSATLFLPSQTLIWTSLNTSRKTSRHSNMQPPPPPPPPMDNEATQPTAGRGRGR